MKTPSKLVLALATAASLLGVAATASAEPGNWNGRPPAREEVRHDGEHRHQYRHEHRKMRHHHMRHMRHEERARDGHAMPERQHHDGEAPRR